jgi:Ca2+-transporting ATPase
MLINDFEIKGLSHAQIVQSRAQFGMNKLVYNKENFFIKAIKGVIQDPMIIMLLVASSIYFFSGNIGDGFFLLSAILFEIGITFYQDARSKNALEKLNAFSQAKSKVIRHGKIEEINSEDIVVGDALLVDEGSLIAADGEIIYSNDFSVNESILTGESLVVSKDISSENIIIYSGTSVVSGLAIATVTAIGNATALGKIGKSLESIKEEPTPLELKIGDFVKKMVIAGIIVFVTVWVVNFIHSYNFLDSLLKSLTLAMSILPEEIAVAFTSFMAIGAWRMMKNGIVVKQMKTVETLGSATVICTDKTGTITENKMSLAKLYVFATNTITVHEKELKEEEKALIRSSMWASEPIPFDPMEVALHDAYLNAISEDERVNFKLIHEYALSGKPPMMTHVFEDSNGQRIIAAKGAPEAILNVSNLTDTDKIQIQKVINTLAAEGYRLLGVAESTFQGNDFPAEQQQLKFDFKGIVAFYDPPKHNIESVLKDFYAAGIDVKIITGDNAETTTAIAKQIGFRGYENAINGDDLMQLSDLELKHKVKETSLFTRMFPDAKLRIINTLKSNNEIVAMTGDGVNDGPALKAAHIGIAMGKKGTEIAKQAASLILLKDDLANMVHAIAMGRRIYSNLKKAIQYIISIHIPIILIVFIPLVLGWAYPTIFSPIHVIFLELIMGPTCSIIFENEPIEKNAMIQKPRPYTATFFNWKELATSIVQGLVITLGVLFIYQYALHFKQSESIIRTMVFVGLVVSNMVLTLVNRSFYYSIFTTLGYKNNLVLIIIALTTFLLGLLLYVSPLTSFFEFTHLTITQLLFSVVIGAVSVLWYELVKVYKRLIKR